MFPNFNREENGRQHHKGEENVTLLLPNPGSKSLNRKSLKKLSFPCCKRPRTDQPNEFVMTDGASDHDAKKIGYNHVRCLFDERCRIVKQKHGQDSKRIDKRSIKAGVKTIFDPCTSKAGLIISDSAPGGIENIGIYGLKTDLHDVAKHVEELSLDELLDGSYKYSNLCPEKRRKALCGNENFLLSVRKACTILPLHGAADSGGNITSLQNPSSLARDEKDKCCEESSNKDSSLAMLNTSTLYQRKDILGQLSLTALDLEAFMLNSNPSQGATHSKALYTTGLPAFLWSFFHGGTCKPAVDSCKISSPRSSGQSKWVRIGTMSTSNGDDNNCFSSLEVNTLDHIDDFANQQKIDELLQDIELLSGSIMPPFAGPQHTESHVLDHNNLIQGSVASASLNSRRLGLLDRRVDTLDNHKEDDSKDHLFHQKFESEVGLTGLRHDLNLVDSPKFDSPFKDSEAGQKEHLERTTDDCFQSCYNYPSKRSTGGCGQSLWHYPVPDIYEPGHSSQLFAAAAVLCEMASCSNAIRTQNDPSLRIKWSRSQKNIKDYKSTSSLEKAKRLLLSSRHQDAFKTKKTLSAHMNNLDREPIKWSLSPRKLERDHVKVGHSTRQSGLMQSPIRIEKVFDNQQKFGKDILKASSTAFGENYIKDWSRGKIKRV